MKTVEDDRRADDRQAELYAAFLLRLWRESAEKPWRASLQSGLGGRQLHFPSLAALFAYLEALNAP